MGTKPQMTALAPTTKRGFDVEILASLKECRTNIIGAISFDRWLYRSGSLAARITQWRQIGVLADLAGSSFGWSIGALHRLDASTKLPSLRGPAHSILVPPWRTQLVGWLDIRVIPSHAIELAAAT